MANYRVREIARRLSLSPSTVSKALRGQSSLVSQSTAERILTYCHTQGYVSKLEVDRILFKMRSGQADRKQIFVLAGRSGIEVYDAVFSGICEQMQDNGLFSSAFVVNDKGAMGRFPFDHAGAVIVLGKMAPGVLECLAEKALPMVLVDNRLPGISTSAVNSNNLEATRHAVRILAEAGHTRIAFLCMHEDEPSITYTFHERQTGYVAEMAALGLLNQELLVAGSVPDYQKGKFEQSKSIELLRSHSQRLLSLNPLPTAVITANDLHAHVLREMLNERGVRVPEDISVIGYDGQHRLSALSPHHFDPVSTMVVKWREMGAVAADLAMEYLYDPQRPVRLVEIPADYENAGTVLPYCTEDRVKV